MRSIRDAHVKAGFTLIILPIIILLSVAQQVILIVAFYGYSLMEKATWTQHYEKTLEQLA